MQTWATVMLWLMIFAVITKTINLGFGREIPAPSRMVYALDTILIGVWVGWAFIVGVRLW